MFRRRPRGRRIAERAPRARQTTTRQEWLIGTAVGLVWLGCLALAVAPLAADHGTDLWGSAWARVGSAAATWLAVLALTRRIGGPLSLVAPFAGVCALALLLEPRGWVLSAGAVVAAVSYGLLGMVLTRPSPGLRSVREAVVVAVVGAAGAVVVTGYDVALRPYRFRMMALALTLLAALVLARRLGVGLHTLGRRGVLLVVATVVVLVLAVVYVQAVRHWGSSSLVDRVSDAHDRIRDWLGASPRSIEALVGFPATIWGVASRSRGRQGWWISAFGSLAAVGVATSLLQPSAKFEEAARATGYDLVIGILLGLVVLGVHRLVTRGRTSSRPRAGVAADRPEPGRLSSLV